MKIRELRIQQLQIPFNVSFRHASAERAATSSTWIEAVSADGTSGYGESCPRPYVTGESVGSAQAFLAARRASLCRDVFDLESLRAWMTRHAADVDQNPAAWCAIELALLDLFARERGLPVEALLSVPPLAGTFQYTAVLGDAAPDAFTLLVGRYRSQGFSDFKVKLAGVADRDRAKLSVFAGDDSVRVRVDANNRWERADDALRSLRDLGCPLFAVEEPIRVNRYEDLASLADALGCRIVLDESLVRAEQIPELPGDRTRWVVNVRVSKMGGLLRSLRLVEMLRAEGLGMIVGAHVGETSLLTRAALTVAHAGADLLVAQEGAFGTHLLAEDVCDPPLMFGPGGRLEVSSHPLLKAPGLGLFQAAPPSSRFVRPLASS